MKLRKVVISTVLVLASYAVRGLAQNVTDDLVAGQEPQTGSVLYYAAPNGNSQGTWALPSQIPGLQGEQGIQGVQGDQGIQGIQGEKGDKGDTGEIDQATLDTINTNQTTETQSRIGADNVLQNNLNATNSRVANVEDEVHRLGETKTIIGGTVRLMDSRKFELHLFDNYDVHRKHNDAFGLLLGYKMGKSYEEREIEALKASLKMYRAQTDKVFKLKDIK